jgi:excinuclease ABC subunit A
VVFTGVSGSGKSSLAFGTLYAEAQRRYLESVAPYVRRLIHQVGAPDVDSIEGLPPAVALQQQRGTPNARSSVGSVTTLSSLVRMLYSRVGVYPRRQPMLYAEDFSPNTPQGACPNCHGLGRVFEVTEQSMVPDPSKTIRERAIASWPPAWYGQSLRDILVALGYDVDIPWRDLRKKDRDWILHTEEQPTVPVYAGFTPAETRAALRRSLAPSYQGTFIGARKYVLHTYATTQSALMKKRLLRFMSGTTCAVCNGKRLKPEALSVTFAGLDIGSMSQLSLNDMARLLAPAAAGILETNPRENDREPARPNRRAACGATARRVAAGGSAHAATPDVRRTPRLSEEKQIAAQRIVQNLLSRIAPLQALGLGYLALDRSTPTLSSGELQRLRIATQIRANLFGVIYVLDEPSAGLHPADADALMRSLDQLKRAGNSIFVVEHDLDIMRRADWLVDVGPAAGAQGGRVLYSGPPQGLRGVPESRTAQYLFAASATAIRVLRPAFGWLELQGISRNNLKGLDVRFPLRSLTTVSGVSGSGKSTLVSQALVELVSAHLGQAVSTMDDGTVDLERDPAAPLGGQIRSGVDAIRRLVVVDQNPIGRTPRSNLATYTGLFDGVRKLFAATREARRRHFDAGRFSFNVIKGRCGTCEGVGLVSVELLFMPSAYAPCPSCHGSRYNEETLKITWGARNIAEILQMTVDEACVFFVGQAAVERPLKLLKDIGLGYLRLGQPATELSGGEAQRIKLATELQRVQHGSSLYVLDEPTSGLHPYDVDKLMVQLHSLVDAGNTVVIIEHRLRVIADSDWIIDMGPGAGDEGGRVVACGTPRDMTAAESRTAPYLRRQFDPGLRAP